MSLHGNTYQVDPALVGRKVELVFSPFDLDTIEVRYRDKSHGKALPHTIARHAHPKAKPETPEPEPPAATGIDYLALTAAAHHEQLRRDERIGYHALYGSTTTARSPASYPSTTFSPASTSTTRVRCRREYSTAAIALGIHPDAVRARPGTGHAAPPRRPRRGRRPHHLVCGPTRDRGDHRRGRRRQDRRRARRHRRPGSVPARRHLPGQPHHRGARHAHPHRGRARAHPRLPHTPPWPRRPPTRWPPNTPNAAATPSLVVDEAHLLDNHQLEAIRLLTNHDMDSGSPFAVLLVGQPTLRQRLRLGVLAALDQRIALRYAIAGMSAADTADYIRHHCKIAGRADTLFSDDAIALIHNASRGHPRAVNNLALHALTAAFAADHAIVDEKAARIAISRNRRGLNPIRVNPTSTASTRRAPRHHAHHGPAHHPERGRSHHPDPHQPQ